MLRFSKFSRSRQSTFLRTVSHPAFYQWNSGILFAITIFCAIRWIDPSTANLPYPVIFLFLLNLSITTLTSYLLVSNRWSLEKFSRWGPVVGMYPFCMILAAVCSFIPQYFAVAALFLAASPFILMEVLRPAFFIPYLSSFFGVFYSVGLIFNPAQMGTNLINVLFGSAMLIVYSLWLLFQSRYVQGKNFQVQSLLRESRRHRRQLDTEKARSDKLLRNILPDEIAEELKIHNTTAPRNFEAATVLFTDFQGFTKIAENLQPHELVAELDRCFSAFDKLMDQNKLEKLKTIGDAYMCVGGIPTPNKTHAIDCVLAALQIQEIMTVMKQEKAKLSLPYWELRIGINTGPIIAGVIGEKKFAYDVWGDTVNTASRLESGGEVGKINISQATMLQVKDFFQCDFRGKVQAKNKGEIEMFFVRQIHPHLSVNGEGKLANDSFKALYEAVG